MARLSRSLGVVLPLLAAICLPPAWLLGSTLACVSDGSAVYPERAGGWLGGVTVSEVWTENGLGAGDLVLAVDGVPLDAWVTSAPRTAAREAGQTLTYSVIQDEEVRNIDVELIHYPLLAAAREHGVILVVPLVALAVAALVFRRRPREPAARLMLTIATLLPLYGTAWPLGLSVVDLAGGCGVWRYVVGDLAATAMWACLLHLTLVFPDRHPVLVRRPWLVGGAYALPLLLYAGHIAHTWRSTETTLERLEQQLLVSSSAALVVPVLAAGLLTGAARRVGDPSTRRPLLWIAGSFLAFLVLFLGLVQLPLLQGRRPLVPEALIALVLLPIPLGVGAVVLRYRLLDIEVIMRRSVVYAALTAALLALALLVTAPALLLLPDEQQDGVLAVAVLASLLTALCLNPLHAWLRRTVGRRIFGARDDPFEVVSQIARLSTAHGSERTADDLVRVLAQALRLPFVEVQLFSPDGAVHTVGRVGEPLREPLALPLQHADLPVGSLLLGVGPGQEPFGPADRRLLDALVTEVSGVAHASLLARSLQRAREGLVTAREEERRRLRRDLHDGIGPTLAAALMRLQAARALQHSQDADELHVLESDIRRALADLRVIVENLRPASLDDLGLVEAVRERATRFALAPRHVPQGGRLRIDVRTEGCLERLPAAAEVAAFRIAVEAITNAAKHSHAGIVTVSLRRDEDGLDVEVRDDGTGRPADARAGVGTQAMAERAAELGGTCAIESPASGGTVVHAHLPL